jgi:GMP synthase-like glutamine amidotransferase
LPAPPWNGDDTFDIPEGAVRLASSAARKSGFCYGQRAYGLQFHPEVSPEMLSSWFADFRNNRRMPLFPIGCGRRKPPCVLASID